MKKTIVLLRNIKYDYFRIVDAGTIEFLADDDIVVSEQIEVEFTMLPEQDLTDKRVAMIDKEISKVRANLHQLEQQKQELLSLPAPE